MKTWTELQKCLYIGCGFVTISGTKPGETVGLNISLNTSCSPALAWERFASESQLKAQGSARRGTAKEGNAFACGGTERPGGYSKRRRLIVTYYFHPSISRECCRVAHGIKRNSRKYIYICELCLGSSGCNCSPGAELLLVRCP